MLHMSNRHPAPVDRCLWQSPCPIQGCKENVGGKVFISCDDFLDHIYESGHIDDCPPEPDYTFRGFSVLRELIYAMKQPYPTSILKFAYAIDLADLTGKIEFLGLTKRSRPYHDALNHSLVEFSRMSKHVDEWKMSELLDWVISDDLNRMDGDELGYLTFWLWLPRNGQAEGKSVALDTNGQINFWTRLIHGRGLCYAWNSLFKLFISGSFGLLNEPGDPHMLQICIRGFVKIAMFLQVARICLDSWPSSQYESYRIALPAVENLLKAVLKVFAARSGTSATSNHNGCGLVPCRWKGADMDVLTMWNMISGLRGGKR